MTRKLVAVSADARARILIVCAANICRSPAGEELLRHQLREIPEFQDIGINFEISSVGTNAVSGHARCADSVAFAGPFRDDVSREFAEIEIESFDLILTMERSHRGLIVAENPRLRSRIFTLRDAGSLAKYLSGPGLVLDVAAKTVTLQAASQGFEFSPLAKVPDLPESAAERWKWFLAELDAWRGQVPMESDSGKFGENDIPDPHDKDRASHTEAFELLNKAILDFSLGLDRILTHPSGNLEISSQI